MGFKYAYIVAHFRGIKDLQIASGKVALYHLAISNSTNKLSRFGKVIGFFGEALRSSKCVLLPSILGG